MTAKKLKCKFCFRKLEPHLVNGIKCVDCERQELEDREKKKFWEKFAIAQMIIVRILIVLVFLLICAGVYYALTRPGGIFGLIAALMVVGLAMKKMPVREFKIRDLF